MLLAVDDNLTICEIVRKLFSDAMTVRIVHTAADGWSTLEQNAESVQVVLLDWELPDQNGIDLLARIKGDPRYRLTPVLMLTGRTNEADIEAGIRNGALYYVTKPFDPRILKTLVETALRDFSMARRREAATLDDFAPLLCDVTFRFRTISEAGGLAHTLASHCPDPDSARLGLHELLVNAVEHGNLAISHDEKSSLLQQGALEIEMSKRQAMSPFAARYASVRMIRSDSELRFIVRDQGDGFDFRKYLSLSPERAFSQHGRGIALARTLAFTQLSYVPPGNEVHARIALA